MQHTWGISPCFLNFGLVSSISNSGSLSWSLYYSDLSLLELKVMLRPTVSQPVCLGIKHPPGASDQIFFTVRQLRVCWCGGLSVMRGRGCRLQLPLALANAVSRPYFTVSDSRLPFSSPPTTRKATVEVFDSASTRELMVLCYSVGCHGNVVYWLWLLGNRGSTVACVAAGMCLAKRFLADVHISS
jgi:hypothetical protein